ncbi:transglycosylase domain-containing protein, partial [Rhizobium phaseoli]
PENYEKKYNGEVTLATALSKSLNTVAAQLVMYDGPDQVIKLAHRLGIESELQPNASIALGTSEVSLMELTASYAAFMNGGYKATPHVIRRVTTADGKVLYENTYDSPPRVLSEQIAAEMDAMMMGVIDNGTGKSAKIPGWQAAGKTGTTQNSRDALFVGFTSNLTTGVWFGNDDGKPMKKVTGGGLPAKAWKEFMIAAHKGLSPAPLFGNGQLIGDPDGQPMAQTAPDGGQPVTAEAPPPTTIGGIISGVFGGNENANRYPQAPVRQQTAPSGNGPVPPADIAEGDGSGYGNVVPPGDVGTPQTTSSVQPRRTTLLDLIMGQ